MSQAEKEEPGTGVKEVLNVLVQTPPERLRSLTYQLGTSPEENIVHALCLIVLQRGEQALNKLQMLRDNSLAKHLFEKWQMSEEKFENFKVYWDHFQEFTSESLITVARVFKVLTEHRLCDVSLRNLAYKRALPREYANSDVEYNPLEEEAKDVCGLELIEFLCKNLKLGSDFHPSCSYAGNTSLTTGIAGDHSKSCLPSPLYASNSMSYPTHLEISNPPTASFNEENTTPKPPESSKPRNAASLVSTHKVENTTGRPQQPQSESIDPRFKILNKSLQIKIPIPSNVPAAEPNSALPSGDSSPEAAAQEQEEVKFYAFVIFHAQQDEDVAESMKEKLESIIKSEGATFSEDFAVPGRSTLRCVEDAVNNSAFTLLLLTSNFNSFLEMKTNSALINSIQNKPKHNTVIPLLPKTNAMPREDIPLVLTTLVPLQENKNFDKKIQKAMTPGRIAHLKEVWMKEQKVKSLRDRQEKLKVLNQQQEQVNEESRRTQLLEQERLKLLNEKHNTEPAEGVGPDGRPWWQQQPNIHIENAQYIMIGNNSQMAVDLSKDVDKEETCP